VTLLLAGTLLAWPAAPAVAQQAGSGLELTGHVGAILPLAELANQGDTIKAELSTKPVFGASLDYWFGESWGVGFTAGITRPNLIVSTVDPVSGFPATDDLGTVDYVHAEGTLLYRPQLPGAAAVLLPYFGVGAGIRSLSFSEDAGVADTDDVVLILNAGGHARLSDRVHLRIDVRDLISSFDAAEFEDSKRQHDVLLSVGLGVKL
jgi:outer membrane protein W